MPLSAQAAILGIVQGATEFLPVSSSAHLILARAFFGFDAEKFGLAFDVACHVGTLIAILVYFRGELARMIGALPRILEPLRGAGGPREDSESSSRAAGAPPPIADVSRVGARHQPQAPSAPARAS